MGQLQRVVERITRPWNDVSDSGLLAKMFIKGPLPLEVVFNRSPELLHRKLYKST